MDRPLQAEKDVVRLPLYDPEKNRVVPAGSRGFTESIGTVQPIHDSVLVNCWAEKDSSGEWTIVKRPGISVTRGDLNDNGAGGTVLGGTATAYKVHAVLALQALPGHFVALVTASTLAVTHLLYWTQDGHLGVADLGATGTTGMWIEIGIPYLSEINIGGYPGIAIAYNYSSGSDCFYYVSTSTTALSGGAVTEITDTDFPAKATPVVPCVGPFVQLNEHVFIMGVDGKVYNSDQGSISSWNVRGVQPASIEPDSGVGLAKYKQHLVAFGTNSMEFFEDAGLAPPGGPLQRTEQAFIKIGCVSGSLIYSIADTLYWVASGTTDTRGLYKLEQYTPVKVSTPAQNPWLGNLDVHSRLGSIFLGGCQHIYVTNMADSRAKCIVSPQLASEATFTPTGTATESYPPTLYDICSSLLCFNIDHQTWWWWTDENIPLLNIFTASTMSQVVGYNNRQILIKSSANRILTTGRIDHIIFTFMDSHITGSDGNFDPALKYTDGGESAVQKAVCVVVQTHPVEFIIENRKAINKIKLIADAMVKYSDDASTGNQLYFLYERLDGQGTVYSRAIDIPSVKHRYYINNCGMTRKLYLSFVCKTAMPLRAKAFELHVTQATG